MHLRSKSARRCCRGCARQQPGRLWLGDLRSSSNVIPPSSISPEHTIDAHSGPRVPKLDLSEGKWTLPQSSLHAIGTAEALSLPRGIGARRKQIVIDL